MPLRIRGPGVGLPTRPALPAAFPTDRCFPLPLALSARLFVEPAFPQFGIEAGPLHLSLEAAQGSLEAFVLLDDDFQGESLSNSARFNVDIPLGAEGFSLRPGFSLRTEHVVLVPPESIPGGAAEGACGIGQPHPRGRG